jgi:Tol biopolymer transport system component
MKDEFFKVQVFITILLLVGCNNKLPIPVSPTVPIVNTQSIQIPSVLPTPTLPNSSIATPTLRVFENDIRCDILAPKNGHILFLQQQPSVNGNSINGYNLYFMDGNGCFHNLVMEQVSGSPAWSKDGVYIAIGCEENSYICIVESKPLVASCVGFQDVDSIACTPNILQKYLLPDWAGSIFNISWSPDNLKIAIDGYNHAVSKYFVAILDLSGDGNWSLFAQGDNKFDVDWSPKENKLAFTGLQIFDLDSNVSNNLIGGRNPQWAPSGKEIAFVREGDVPDVDLYKTEPTGIGIFYFQEDRWQWIYEPATRDIYYYPPKNLFIGMSGDYRELSWDPTGRYIAFVSTYLHDYDTQIFRLDILTGEIVVLTAGFVSPNGSRYSFAPAWGP